MKQTLSDKISARFENARLTVAALTACKSHLPPNFHDELDALAMRIHACNHPANQFIATDAVNYETGEAYDAHGPLWQCNSKLCTNCVADQSRRNRAKLRKAFDAQKLHKGERYYFVTFTIKNPNTGLTATREIVNYAWSLFRKRSLCVDSISGGVKSEEFTLTANGFHYHLHCILRSSWLLYNELRRTWTECVANAFEQALIPFEVNTRDGFLIINFKQIHQLGGAVQEVCKYITKSDSWSKMRPEDLADIALIHRWFRMFEMFGSFSNREVNDSDDREEREASLGYVHTTHLSDGPPVASKRYWRDILRTTTLKRYTAVLLAEIETAQAFRSVQIAARWPTAKLSYGDSSAMIPKLPNA